MEQKIILLYHLRTQVYCKKKLDPNFYVFFSILLNQSGNFKLFFYMLLLVPCLKLPRIQLGLIVALISTNAPWNKLSLGKNCNANKMLPLILLFPINQVLTSQSNNVSLIIFPFRQQTHLRCFQRHLNVTVTPFLSPFLDLPSVKSLEVLLKKDT